MKRIKHMTARRRDGEAELDITAFMNLMIVLVPMSTAWHGVLTDYGGRCSVTATLGEQHERSRPPGS